MKNNGHARCLSYPFLFRWSWPLFSADNLDSEEKTLIAEVMVIEDYIVIAQIRKLVLRISIAYHDNRMVNSLYFLDKSIKICKNKNMHNFSIFC